MTMKTSAIGRAVLTAREGVRLKAYRDSVGILTVGVGHTGRASPPLVTPGMTITAEQADAFLAGDLAPFEAAVNEAVRVPMAQNVFDGLVSFAFNVGAPGFKGSTAVRKLNAGDLRGAADALLMWNKPTEIVTRREAEREQLLHPYDMAMPVPRSGEKAIRPPAKPTVVAPSITPSPKTQPKTGLFGWLSGLFSRKATS